MFFNKKYKNINFIFYIFIFLLFQNSAHCIDNKNLNSKIEVLEFFSYNCSSCANTEKIIKNFKLNKDIIFIKIPLAFNTGMRNLQQLFFTINELKLIELHEDIFKNVTVDHQKLYYKKEIDKWIKKYNINEHDFNKIFYSYKIKSKMKAADYLAKTYNIQHSPIFIINRKFATSSKLNGDIANFIKLNDLISNMISKL